MVNHVRCAFVTALALALLALAGCGGESVAIESELARQIDRLVRPYVEIGDFSGVVQVTRGDDVLFARAYGAADRERGVPNDVDSAFLIGSISKQFTCAAILLLQQDGLLSVDDTLDRFAADFPRAGEITLHQLMTHTAGVPDVYELPQYATGAAEAPPLTEIVGYLAERPFHFAPGEGYAYSNGGYTLLAQVIEVAARTSYPEFVESRILDPLGMTGSGLLSGSVVDGLSRGYDPRGVTGFVPAAPVGATWMHGSGSIYSTAADLYRWDRALRGDALLDAASREAMTTDHGHAYGYGVSIYRRHGDAVIEHDGRIVGYAADLARYVDADAAVILLSNVQSVARDHLRDDIGALLYGATPAERTMRVSTTREVAAAELDLLEGAYGFGPSLTVRVRSDGRTLWLRANAGSESEFFPAGDGTFFSRALYAAVSFDRGADGAIVSMRYMPEGGNFEGRRLDDG